MFDRLLQVGACVCITGKRKRGQVPIDVLAVGHSLGADSGRDLGPSISDHSILEVVCKGVVAEPDLPSWQLASVPRAPVLSESLPDVRRLWQEISCSQADWNAFGQGRDIDDDLWRRWSKDASAWLQIHGLLVEGSGERPLGATPVLRNAGSRRRPARSVEEHMLRRLVHRVEELDVKSLTRHASAPLQAAVRRSLNSDAELLAFSEGDWPLLSHLVRARLQAYLQSLRARAISRWRARPRNLGYVCKRIKRKAPSPHAFRRCDGFVVYGRAACAQALRAAWDPSLCDPVSPERRVVEYRRAFGQDVNHSPGFHLDPRTVADLQDACRRGTGAATGPDGWYCDLLLRLPPEAYKIVFAMFCFAASVLVVGPRPLVTGRSPFCLKDGGEGPNCCR